MLNTVAIIGGGQGAAVAARSLRRKGFDGSVEIIGDEPHRPYHRPPLSKEYLESGDASELFLLPEEWCEQHDVRLRLGVRASRIDAASAAVELADGSTLDTDAVLIATGGRPRRLQGVSGDRVHYLRYLDDSDRLRERLSPGVRVIIVGAGFIGSEVAATARARGAEVVIVEAMAAPLHTLLGGEVGAACGELHRRNGVTLRLGEQVRAVEQNAAGVIVTTSGGRVEGDVVVVGIGIEPDVAVAETSGIATGNGILVDERCATNVPHVFAVGDVANQQHPLFGTRIRVEHVDNANQQARLAADSILGRAGNSPDPHWFYSDQYDVSLLHTGHAGGTDQIVLRGSIDELDFVAFYLANGRLRAAFGMDRGAEVMAARELIAAGAKVAAGTLRDEDVDLMELALSEECA